MEVGAAVVAASARASNHEIVREDLIEEVIVTPSARESEPAGCLLIPAMAAVSSVECSSQSSPPRTTFSGLDPLATGEPGR
jgi:hypothetical protein